MELRDEDDNLNSNKHDEAKQDPFGLEGMQSTTNAALDDLVKASPPSPAMEEIVSNTATKDAFDQVADKVEETFNPTDSEKKVESTTEAVNGIPVAAASPSPTPLEPSNTHEPSSDDLNNPSAPSPNPVMEQQQPAVEENLISPVQSSQVESEMPGSPTEEKHEQETQEKEELRKSPSPVPVRTESPEPQEHKAEEKKKEEDEEPKNAVEEKKEEEIIPTEEKKEEIPAVEEVKETLKVEEKDIRLVEDKKEELHLVQEPQEPLSLGEVKSAVSEALSDALTQNQPTEDIVQMTLEPAKVEAPIVESPVMMEEKKDAEKPKETTVAKKEETVAKKEAPVKKGAPAPLRRPGNPGQKARRIKHKRHFQIKGWFFSSRLKDRRYSSPLSRWSSKTNSCKDYSGKNHCSSISHSNWGCCQEANCSKRHWNSCSLQNSSGCNHWGCRHRKGPSWCSIDSSSQETDSFWSIITPDFSHSCISSRQCTQTNCDQSNSHPQAHGFSLCLF